MPGRNAMKEENSIVIVGASRTPAGRMQGAFEDISASELGGAAISGALANAGLGPDAVDEQGLTAPVCTENLV
jgi:acetyl-CoA C-acetyltransferase